MTNLSAIISRGVAASRPAANSLPVGSLYYSTDTGVVERTNGSTWDSYGGAGMTNPMTTQDDLIVGGSSGTPARLAKGTDGQVLTVDPATHHLVWATPSAGGAPATARYRTAAGYSTSSTSFVSVDGTNMALTITTGANKCMVGFAGTIRNQSAGQNVNLDVDLDGTRLGDATTGLILSASRGAFDSHDGSFALLTAALTAASHTFTLKWCVLSSGTADILPGAVFWVCEIA